MFDDKYNIISAIWHFHLHNHFFKNLSSSVSWSSWTWIKLPLHWNHWFRQVTLLQFLGHQLKYPHWSSFHDTQCCEASMISHPSAPPHLHSLYPLWILCLGNIPSLMNCLNSKFTFLYFSVMFCWILFSCPFTYPIQNPLLLDYFKHEYLN